MKAATHADLPFLQFNIIDRRHLVVWVWFQCKLISSKKDKDSNDILMSLILKNIITIGDNDSVLVLKVWYATLIWLMYWSHWLQMPDILTKNVYSAKQGICSFHRTRKFITTCPKSASFDLILIQLNHIFTSYFPMNNFDTILTEQSGVALIVYTSIWDVPSLNLGCNTHYPDWGLSQFVSVHPSKYKTVPQLGHDHLLPSIFQFVIHQSPYYQCHNSPRN